MTKIVALAALAFALAATRRERQPGSALRRQHWKGRTGRIGEAAHGLPQW
jgi:hypothetical protein